MNVIFLDFDGVINTLNNTLYPREDENAVERRIKILGDICKLYDCKVVIESSYKDHINEETKVLTKAIPPNFTCWDYIEIEGNKTVDELLDFINEKYQIEVNGLYTLNTKIIIKDESTLNLNFQEAYYNTLEKNKEYKIKAIYFKILADLINDENTHVKMTKFNISMLFLYISFLINFPHIKPSLIT